MVLFDLAARKFYIFGLLLFPQDFIFLAVLLIICAYSLFLFTAISGRVWCGFSCPQTVYTEIFMWIENKIEGTRSTRMRLARQGMTLEKASKKTAKHAVWGGIALWTGFTFVGYFTPIQALWTAAITYTLGGWEVFWILFYASATYGNAGFMREQFCRYICPYARFQGSMLDKDTLIVSYDKTRGEPRQSLAKKGAAHSQTTAGSCIDCSLCVQVCPTGIDIRNGLQHDCIGCAACIDACDSVMDKISAPRGLIRFTTENASVNQLSQRQIVRNIFRPRVLIYGSILCAIIAVFAWVLASHTLIKMNVIRDRGNMARITEDGAVQNIYRLHLMNADEHHHQFQITVSGIDDIKLAKMETITINATESAILPITVQVPARHGEQGANRIHIEVRALDQPELSVREAATFYIPR